MHVLNLTRSAGKTDTFLLLVSGYLELDSGVFTGGQIFDISMDFRTDQLNALLLFTYNTQTEDFMLVKAETCFKLSY